MIEKIKEKLKRKDKEGNTKYDVFKVQMVISAAVLLLLVVVSSVAIFIKITKLGPDNTMMSFIYILSAGWFVAIVMLIPIIMAWKEIFTKLRTIGRKSRVVILRMIGGDANEKEIILPLSGNTIEIGENKVIINPRKSTMKDGIRVMTYVSDNALAHDYFQNPKETLKDIGNRINSKKDEDFHDIFSDPIRIDAKYFNETFLAAQQTNPDILKKIIAFLTSKNVIGLLVIIAVAAAIGALLSLQANNLLNSIPYCNPTQITP